ncbi:hypothetical protein GCM10022393_07410 [Aquimarina addita]|uniref:DUF4252 domain-containing protein n=1 Tax=Aquimarina addita TaxID=870485 RepID=A0ABP7XBB9_9FLAO
MKKILLLLSVILLTGCEYISSEKKASSEVNYKKNTFEFKENTITLTNGYIKMSPEEFTSRLDSLKTGSPKLKKVAIEELEKIQAKKVDFELFVHEKNIENYVFIYACDYFQLDEDRAANVVTALSNQLKMESTKQKVRYKRIHGRFFFTPTSKVVKLKYLKAFEKEKKFQTEYIVASKSGGIGLLISNLENVDFESSIKRLAAK